MSLPIPNNRFEQYLNAIATGNADGLPLPITREELYLYFIAKNGGGGGGTGDVTGVKGAAESTYRKGNVNITPQNIGVNPNAQVNVIEHIYANGVEVVPQNKGVYLTLLDNTVNNLTNYYLKTETYTKTEVDTIIGSLSHLALEIVASLPTQDISTTTIYLVETSAGSHVYMQYAYIDNAWAQLGTTQIDLTNYYNKSEVDLLLLAKQDVLTFDATPTASSTNPVESGGVYSALQGKQDTLTFDNVPTANSNNPVKSGGVYTALEGKQDVVQVSSMPSASAGAGKVYQYIGTTTQDFTHGYFYEVQSGAWVNVQVSEGGSGSGGHSIKDNGTAMADESALNFTDFDISDDSTNNETDIKAHRLTSAELQDIVSPLPSAVLDMPVLYDERGIEYQVGWYVLANGKKKPVYKKELTLTLNASVSTNEVQIGARIDYVLDISGYVLDSSNTWSVLNCMNNGLTELTKMYVRTDDYSDASGKNKIIVYNSHTSFFNCPVKISIKYTKTTDTPV